MSTPTLAFVDVETTGLDPYQHEIWEVAVVLVHPEMPDDARLRAIGLTPENWSREARGTVQSDGSVMTEYVWHLPVDLGRADPVALRIGRFYERWEGAKAYTGTNDPWLPGVFPTFTPQGTFADVFARLTNGTVLIGCVPSFDETRLWRLLRENGACPGWHYQPVDVETLAVGFLAGRRDDVPPLPWDSEVLSRAVGVDPDRFDRHTALGDALWAKAIYEAVLGPQNRSE